MTSDPRDDEIDWAPLATVPTVAEARELMRLLEAARIDAQLLGSGIESTWTVLVPSAEVPVAAGVAERFLPWFAPESEGETGAEECLAALDQPHEEEFAEALARERNSGRRRHRVLAAGAVLLVGTGLVFMIWQIARWLSR